MPSPQLTHAPPESLQPPTARCWLLRHGGLPHPLVERLFRERRVRVLVGDSANNVIDSVDNVSGGRPRRVAAATRLAPGSVVLVPSLASAATPPPPMTRALTRAMTPSPRNLLTWLRSLVLHVDDDLVVINKPAGLPCQGGAGITQSLDGFLPALAQALAENPVPPPVSPSVPSPLLPVMPGKAPLHLVHRLDRDVSGCLLLARGREAAAALTALFRRSSASASASAASAASAAPPPLEDDDGSGGLSKVYWALLADPPAGEQPTLPSALAPGIAGRVTLPLRRPGGGSGRHGRGRGEAEVLASAVTDYRVLATSSSPPTSSPTSSSVPRMVVHWLELAPRTGRKHQLRLHCALALGSPILGDAAYEFKFSDGPRVKGRGRGPPTPLMLHCRSIELAHPRTGEALRVVAPLAREAAERYAQHGFRLPPEGSGAG